MKKILIVDDSKTARMFIRTCFNMCGYDQHEFVEAVNGKEALDLIKGDYGVPDLLVTDINMPIMNGIDLLKKIRVSPQTTGIPVLVITSTSNRLREEDLERLGNTSVLMKPISPARLLEALKQVVEEGV
ncbi:MAG: response regulator [Candidatus Cloacimonadota bacterium]|nr:MAG: response regulator [Candidatus Cloacimonadota bacterium]